MIYELYFKKISIIIFPLICCVIYIEQKSKRSNETSNDDEDDSDNDKDGDDNNIDDDDEDDSKLLSVSACNNTLNLVMRDPGTTLKFSFRLETVYWFQKPYIGIAEINITLCALN